MEKFTKEQIDKRLAKLRESRLADETYEFIRPAMAMCYSISMPHWMSERRQCASCGKIFAITVSSDNTLKPKTADEIAEKFRRIGMEAQFRCNCDECVNKLNAVRYEMLVKAGDELKWHISFPDIRVFHNENDNNDIKKEEVRKIALEYDLITAKKKDSTGICFIGERNYQKFIENYLKPNPGDIVDVETKEVIGRHTGLMNYTIGQRRNVGISGNLERHYVCGKNVEKNILYVAFGEDNKYLMSDECIIDNVNFLSDLRPTFCTAKFRYRDTDHAVELEYLENNKIRVKYPEKVKAVTPGQACVLYLGEECLGCGFIDTVKNNEEYLWYLHN